LRRKAGPTLPKGPTKIFLYKFEASERVTSISRLFYKLDPLLLLNCIEVQYCTFSMDSAFEASTARAILRSEPSKLTHEIADVQLAIQSLSLANYNVHIENHKTERETKEKLAAGSELVKQIEITALAGAARLGSLEGKLQGLYGAHAKLRQTLLHHSSVVELLEAPTVMESCVRSSMLDEALDVSEYASTLFFSHKLWMPRLESASTGPTSVVERVVNDIQVATNDLRSSILRQLAGKITLPLALRLLGHLRRLYSQRELARKRTLELLQFHAIETTARSLPPVAGSCVGASASAERYLALASSSLFVLSPEEDQAIVALLRAEFLQV
jgi:hypothetical protein